MGKELCGTVKEVLQSTPHFFVFRHLSSLCLVLVEMILCLLPLSFHVFLVSLCLHRSSCFPLLLRITTLLPPPKRPDQFYHVTVMPCFDKKLEASRNDFYNEIYQTRDVDCVITSSKVHTIQVRCPWFSTSTHAV